MNAINAAIPSFPITHAATGAVHNACIIAQKNGWKTGDKICYRFPISILFSHCQRNSDIWSILTKTYSMTYCSKQQRNRLRNWRGIRNTSADPPVSMPFCIPGPGHCSITLTCIAWFLEDAYQTESGSRRGTTSMCRPNRCAKYFEPSS